MRVVPRNGNHSGEMLGGAGWGIAWTGLLGVVQGPEAMGRREQIAPARVGRQGMDAKSAKAPYIESTPTASKPATPRGRWRRIGGLLSAPLSLLLTLPLLLSPYRPDDANHAHASRATLDHELTHARSDLGVPDSMLAPISTQA